jgi:RNA polymerase sigma factor (sigma-70 family)
VNREDAAFAELMKRHGPMVLGVCRRASNTLDDADDAFQATFLVLVRKAGSIRRGESLGSWLHGVAYRVARQTRIRAEQRRARERRAMNHPDSDPSIHAARRELRLIVDEELDRLPAKYRCPLVLHYLEGKTKEETARQLGWTEGTVSGRLARGRDLLRSRLGRRGLALSGAMLGVALVQEGTAASVPMTLAESTLTLALRSAAGQLAGGASAARIAALAESAVKAMFLSRLKIATAVVLVAAAVALGAGGLLHRTPGD